MKNVISDTKKSRGRPARLDKAQAVTIAEQLFHQDGYDQLGVSTICDALGVGQPALYRLFGNKAGLFEAVLERYLTTPHATFISEQVERSETPDELARNILLSAAEIYTNDPIRRGCLAMETTYGSADKAAQLTANHLVEQTRSMLAQQFKTLGAKDADARANAILVVLRGLSSEARIGRSKESLQDAVSVLIA